jgi:hypothetical protein
VENEREATTPTVMITSMTTTMTKILNIPGRVVPPDETKTAGMVAAIDPRLVEAKDESTLLRPMTIIDTEIVTIPTIRVVIATPVAPKKRNA